MGWVTEALGPLGPELNDAGFQGTRWLRESCGSKILFFLFIPITFRSQCSLIFTDSGSTWDPIFEFGYICFMYF